MAMKWGLVPVWSKSATPHPCPVNARAETIHEKNTFRRLVDTRRCVIVADGYFEWKRHGPSQGPYFFSPGASSHDNTPVKTEENVSGAVTGVTIKKELKNDEPASFPPGHPLLRMAGLWDTWTNQETGETLYSYTVLTVFASQLTSTIHDRMPALLWNEADVDLWLNPANPYSKVKHLLEPSENLTIWPVSEIVGNVKNDTPECIKPIDRKKEEKKLITSFFKPKPKTEPKTDVSSNSSISSETTLPASWATEDLSHSFIDENGQPITVKTELMDEQLEKMLEEVEKEVPRSQNAKRAGEPLSDEEPVHKRTKK